MKYIGGLHLKAFYRDTRLSPPRSAVASGIEYLLKYFRYGAYPFYQESTGTYSQKLLEVVNITIDSDLCGLYNIEPEKVDKLKEILYMLCSTPPVELNKSKLGSAVVTSWPTPSKYLALMQAGGLIHSVRAGSGMRTAKRTLD